VATHFASFESLIVINCLSAKNSELINEVYKTSAVYFKYIKSLIEFFALLVKRTESLIKTCIIVIISDDLTVDLVLLRTSKAHTWMYFQMAQLREFNQ
jgi:hypothetical protein